MKVGILSLQGAVEPHAEKISALGAEVVRVKTPELLEGLSGIILPGGESTTMIHLLHLNHLWKPLERFVQERPTFGVCAGAILLAHRVSSPSQASLDALDIEVDRNAYGRQVYSFIDKVTPTAAWSEAGNDNEPIEGVFIRAPKFTRVGPKARVLLEWKGEPVMVEQGHLLAASFHPELTQSDKIHRYFLNRCRKWTSASQNI